MTSPQEKGGKARADALTPDERKAIARKAALSRWEKNAPRSSHEGEFMLADVLVSCAVLPSTRQRIITQATFLRALGRSRSPKGGTGVFATVDGIPFFLQAEALKPFITDDLVMSTTPVFYITKEDNKGVGYDARILPNVADVYLRYRDSLLREGKSIPERYAKIFGACDALMRFLAKEGIVSLVDKATGYTEELERDVVARLLEAYISDKLRPYAKTFPVAWFKEVCRVRGIKFSADMRLPRYFGKIVNDLVYDRLAPGVRQWLDDRNPAGEDGRRKHKKFQHLTAEFGKDELLFLLGRQREMLSDFGDGEWDAFYDKLNRKMPPHQPLPLFDQIQESEEIEAPTSPLALPETSGPDAPTSQ